MRPTAQTRTRPIPTSNSTRNHPQAVPPLHNQHTQPDLLSKVKCHLVQDSVRLHLLYRDRSDQVHRIGPTCLPRCPSGLLLAQVDTLMSRP